MSIVGHIFLFFIAYPLFGVVTVFSFAMLSFIITGFFNFFNIKPTHYKYISYTKLLKHSKVDHLKEFLEGNVDKNLEKIADKLPENYKENLYFKNGCERIVAYKNIAKKNKLKNSIILYFILMMLGFISFQLSALLDTFVLNAFPNSILISIDEDGYKTASMICMLIIFGIITLLYYFLDFIYSFVLASTFSMDIEYKAKEEQEEIKQKLESYKSNLK